MHIVLSERQTDHKLRVQCQNSNKGVEVQVSAQNIQQYTDMVLCCNVNNKKMLGKREQNESLDVSWGVLWVNKTVYLSFCHLNTFH